jgi:glycosyltransferase involved in cell wall biosynthesis
MRIAYVCADPGVPVFGRKGCSVHVQEMIRAFQRHGAEVELFAARADDPRPHELEGIRLHHLPAVRDGGEEGEGGEGGGPAGHAAAVAALNRELGSALDRAGPFDLVYERYSLWSFAGMVEADASGTPGLLEVNAPLIEEQAQHRSLRDAGSATRVAARAFGAADALLAVSTEVAAWLERHPSAQGRVHVIPNGVDAERFRPDVPPAAPGPPGSFTVGFVGSMKPWHGLDVLVEAFDRLHRRSRDTRLLLVGEGPALAAVSADLSARGLAKVVQCTGAVAPVEVPGLLTSVDAAVAPYPDASGFYFSPLKVYEYMAAGRAVVASRVGQLETVIRHDVNGLLCPPGDPGALEAELERLQRAPQLRARLGRAARGSVRRTCTWDAVARRVLQLAGGARRGRQGRRGHGGRRSARVRA